MKHGPAGSHLENLGVADWARGLVVLDCQGRNRQAAFVYTVSRNLGARASRLREQGQGWAMTQTAHRELVSVYWAWVWCWGPKEPCSLPRSRRTVHRL